jgi:DNA-binding CsgD family transcriptional regulator
MELVHNLLSVRTAVGFKSCFKRLQNLFLYDSSMCALSDMDTLKNREPQYIYHTMNLPREFPERYAKEFHYVKSTIFNAALTNYQPYHWETYWSKNVDNNNTLCSGKQLTFSYGYKDGWISATGYQNDPSVGILIFTGQKVDTDTRTESIIKFITPHFSEAIKRTCHSSIRRLKQSTHFKLTPRELEVLKWIKEGKSSWDISTILSRSERVVTWHANNIMQKIGAKNRTQAIAIAMQYKLID